MAEFPGAAWPRSRGLSLEPWAVRPVAAVAARVAVSRPLRDDNMKIQHIGGSVDVKIW